MQALGLGLGTYIHELGQSKIVVGHDFRSYSLSIKQALSKMTDYIAQDLDHEGRVCAICHCNNPRRAQMVKEMLEERCRFQKFEMLEAGGVTTVYANDGGIVVSY